MLIGRVEEQERLLNAYHSDKSEFVAVYGRRRVGKTYLVRETFAQKFTFTYTGIANKNTRGQLQAFHTALKAQGDNKSALPANWPEAFAQLAALITQSKAKRQVVFIDEMPWMDAPRSGFISALEHFWNAWADARKDIVLIVCGSASSWIINKILKNKGGLHNRVTTRIHLKPFTLYDCEAFVRNRKITMRRMQMAEAYMIMGGIPFYWSKLEKTKSLSQNIDNLFFASDGEFRYEFNELYASLFNKPEKYLKIIDALASQKKGLTREAIVKRSKLEDNGQLTKMLEELAYCGFIRKYCNIGKKVKHAIYQLVDNYTLFYYHFLKNNPGIDEHYWSKSSGRPDYNTWCGLAFERLCLLHIRQIKKSLGINGILTNVYSWFAPHSDGKPGAQIDLLIDRSDGVVNICEMKYAKTKFAITAKYRKELLNKETRFLETTKTNKAVHWVMITSNGLEKNQYADFVNNSLSLDDLFTV